MPLNGSCKPSKVILIRRCRRQQNFQWLLRLDPSFEKADNYRYEKRVNMASIIELAALAIGAFLLGTSTRGKFAKSKLRFVQIGLGVAFVALGLLMALH